MDDRQQLGSRCQSEGFASTICANGKYGPNVYAGREPLVPRMEFDRTDVEILRALQEDARLSFRDLAQRIGVSVPTVSARVATLEQLGILRGYAAIVDSERLGQVSLVVVAKCQPTKADVVGDALAAMEEVRWAARARGSRVLAEAVLPRQERVDAFLEKLEGIDGVLEYEHHVATKRLKGLPRAVVTDRLSTTLICFQCRKVIEGEPIKLKMDGRDHYLCCRSCEKLYTERYAKIKAAAR